MLVVDGPSPTRRRSVEQWNARVCELPTARSFGSISPRERTIYTLRGERFPVDVLIDLKENRPLLVTFHGALPEGINVALPFFSGNDLAQALGVSHVAFSDPVLHLHSDLRIAWFSGARGFACDEIISRVMERVFEIVNAKDAVVMGGSSGGFTSLRFACSFPAPRYLVWNPQTNLLAYNRELVEQYADAAFNWRPNEPIAACLSSHVMTDIIPGISNASFRSSVIYLQNIGDIHVVRHLSPLLQALQRTDVDLDRGYFGWMSDTIWLALQSWGEGHCPPPRAMLRDLLSRLFELGGDRPVHVGDIQEAVGRHCRRRS